MKKIFKRKIIQSITDFYIKSGDFNGIPVGRLLDKFECSWAKLKLKLIELLRENKITLAFGRFGNPHIKRFPDPPLKDQEEYLKSAIGADQICAYPTKPVISSAIDISSFSDRTFTQMVLLGAPQVFPTLFFEMKVLERYYNDPRYICWSADYRGQINLEDSYSDDPNALERDKATIEFGLGYDDENNRVITVPLRRLYRLPPEQQQHWKTHMVNIECKMSDSYYRNIILGEFADGVSIYKALIKEQEVINDMCRLIGKPGIFKKTYDNERPRNFSIMLLPTRRNYLSFIHTIDKMISENLNKAFFKNDIILEEEIKRKDVRIEISQKGTVRLLDEWLRKFINVQDNKVFDEINEPLREVRQIRQEPAHSITDDEFDKKYWIRQNEILEKVYNSLRCLRLLFALHPDVKDYKIPDWLYEGRIISY